MSRWTIDVADRDAKDPSGLIWMEAPLAERGSSSIIKDRMTDALHRVHTLDAAISPDMKREKAAAGEVTCFRFSGILRRWSENRILLRVCNARQKQQRECRVKKRETLHASNESELSHRWRERVRQTWETVS